MSCLILCAGCIDDPVIPNGSINGTAYDKYGMQNPFTFVSVGDYPIIGLDRFGNFSIENTTIPYNLTLSDGYGEGTKYIGLTNINPVVCEFEDFGYARSCYTKVLFPKMNNHSQAIIKFISKDPFTQFSYYAFSVEDTVFHLEIEILNDKDWIQGTLIYLGFDSYYSFNYYKKFGQKNITLKPGYNNSFVTFSESDISYNPEEITTDYNIQVPDLHNEFHTTAYLVFPGMHFASNLEIPSYAPYLSGSVFLPLLPQLTYNVKLESNVHFNDNSPASLYSKKWQIVEPGADVNFTHRNTISLQSPPDGETNITDSTKFRFSDAEPGGVYIYRFFHYENNPNHYYSFLNIVTDKTLLEFKDLKTRGTEFEKNKIYYWCVYKYPGYTDINEFTSRKFMEDTIYTSTPASGSFSFTIR